MKFNQMPQGQEKLPTLLGSKVTLVPVGEQLGRDEDLDALIEKVAQKLGESGLPRALKFMSKMFGPMAETSPEDNRCRWWETAWKRKREGGDECMNVPEAQEFSRMASLLVHEIYMLDDATWSAISGVDVGSSFPKDPLIEILDEVRQFKENPFFDVEDSLILDIGKAHPNKYREATNKVIYSLDRPSVPVIVQCVRLRGHGYRCSSQRRLEREILGSRTAMEGGRMCVNRK